MRVAFATMPILQENFANGSAVRPVATPVRMLAATATGECALVPSKVHYGLTTFRRRGSNQASLNLDRRTIEFVPAACRRLCNAQRDRGTGPELVSPKDARLRRGRRHGRLRALSQGTLSVRPDAPGLAALSTLQVVAAAARPRRRLRAAV